MSSIQIRLQGLYAVGLCLLALVLLSPSLALAQRPCTGPADAGGPCNTGLMGICAQGVEVCLSGIIICERVHDPQPEICDGLDNDCNGQIDDYVLDNGTRCDTGLTGICAEGAQRCVDGVMVCQQLRQPTDETCNGQDDNCDGSTDEGNPGGDTACNTHGIGVCGEGKTRCINGGLICVATRDPGPELCNNLDDNCDGRVDEGNPGGGEPCAVPGQQGICAIGITDCQNGVLRCLPQVVPGQLEEVCDGIDNNCDGRIDEESDGPLPGVGEACATNCGAGVVRCIAGQLRCDGPQEGTPEICDGLDNDCDGIIDNDVPGEGLDCNTGLAGVCAQGKTSCTEGNMICTPLLPIEEQRGVEEICDGIDNNCDGNVDEGNPGGGLPCLTEEHGVCAHGTTVCTEGRIICRRDAQPSAEICNGQDDNCDGRVDEGNPGGGLPCDTGLPGLCAQGVTNCRDGEIVCDAIREPGAEICDGLDNNCDGQIDEDNPGGGDPCDTGELGQCALGTRTCSEGRLRCVPHHRPEPEVCDGVDNNCDGRIDESDPQLNAECATGGEGQCAGGRFLCTEGALLCTPDHEPAEEVCDGKDNNCDGQIDEGNPGGGEPCTVPGLYGECRFGTTNCTAGQLLCTGNPQPTDEICDGLDNNCDGQIDEDPIDAQGPCDTGLLGPCAQGTLSCANGQKVCTPLVQPQPEVCDGVDNNCDGQIDEGDWGAEACTTGEVGRCAEGRLFCEGGREICQPLHEPTYERCNGLDDNCDGVVDEGLRGACGTCEPVPEEICDGIDNDCNGLIDDGDDLCARGELCILGACVPRCLNNECVGAVLGHVCLEGGCVDPCVAARCPEGFTCHDGQCADPCAGVGCPPGETCVRRTPGEDQPETQPYAECAPQHCYEAGCESGELCLSGRCRPDPCEALACEPGEFCRITGEPPAAECVRSCAEVSCRFGEVCTDGACVADPCHGVECDEGDACVSGRCVADACEGLNCGVGRLCLNGHCLDDPCAHTECPLGERCEGSSGFAECVVGWPLDERADFGVDPPDAGADSGVEDAGQTDAGLPADAASTRPDGGRPSQDARVDTGDGSIYEDLGSTPSLGATDEGCGCSQLDERPSPTGLWWLAALLLWGGRRKVRVRS